jgi:hypothetical protein
LCFDNFGVLQNNLARSFFGVARLEGVDEEDVTLLLVGVPTLLSPQSLIISELFFFLRLPKKPSFPMSYFHTNPRVYSKPMSRCNTSKRLDKGANY